MAVSFLLVQMSRPTARDKRPAPRISASNDTANPSRMYEPFCQMNDVSQLSSAADGPGQMTDVDERLPQAGTCRSSGPSNARPQSRSGRGQLIEARLSAAMISSDNPPIPATVRMTCQRHQSSRSCIQSVGGALTDQVITIALIG